MTCDEVQNFWAAYLDSELDARTALEVAAHLKSCAACASRFAGEEKMETLMKGVLGHGERTDALWEGIERAVVSVDTAKPAVRPAGSFPPFGRWQAILLTVREQFLAGWNRSPRAWAGLAAVWGVILVLNLTGRESAPQMATRAGAPSASEMRFAMQQKQLLMAELAPTPEAAPVKTKSGLPGPRSERRESDLKT